VRRRDFIALLGSAAAIRPLGARGERPPAHILYFTYSAGYKHDVIPLSKAVLTQLGRNSGVFEVASVWQDPRYQQILTNAILWSMRRSP
jgi:uncharacterized protein